MTSGRFSIIAIGSLFCAVFYSVVSFAAIGCTLSNPAEDLKYLYPELTSYREELTEFSRLAQGRALYDSLKLRVGRDPDPVYESFETPYTVYSVFKESTRIGIVHGVNVPGSGGVIQVFVAVDPTQGSIKKFFFQRLESPAADALRKKEFRAQFEGLSLADFYKHDYYSSTHAKGKDPLARIRAPALNGSAEKDYETSIRGLRKNLVLLDFFVFKQKNEPFFIRAQSALQPQGKTP